MSYSPDSSLPGCANFRDVGGLPARAGTVRRGRLFRSDGLFTLDDAGAEAMAERGVGTIVDLRSPLEIQQRPDRVDPQRFTLLSRPLLDGAIKRSVEDLPTLSELYLGLLRDAGEVFSEIARLVAYGSADSPAERPGVLVHCTAGKDRTGVAVALLLRAVEVPAEHVIADYAATENNLRGPWSDGMFEMIAGFGVEITDEIRQYVSGAPAPALAGALEYVESAHGGAAGYLRDHGLDADGLDALRRALVAV